LKHKNRSLKLNVKSLKRKLLGDKVHGCALKFFVSVLRKGQFPIEQGIAHAYTSLLKFKIL
jgi:hypothetical protein